MKNNNQINVPRKACDLGGRIVKKIVPFELQNSTEIAGLSWIMRKLCNT